MAPTEALVPSVVPTPAVVGVPIQAELDSYLERLCPNPIGGRLRVLAWEGYADDEFAEPFEQRCGVSIEFEPRASSEELIARREAGEANADVIAATSDAATHAVARGLIRVLDASRLPSLASLDPVLLNAPVPVNLADEIYGVPFAAGVSPLIFSTTHFDSPLETWNVLWDPGLAGRTAVQDDLSTVWMVAQSLGLDDPDDPAHLYNLDDTELQRVRARLDELFDGPARWWLYLELPEWFSQGEIVAAQGWEYHARVLREAGFPVGVSLPEEGATGWIDYWMIPASAENPEAAYAWLELTSQPFVQAIVAAESGYTVSHPLASHYLSPQQVAAMQSNNVTRWEGRVNFWQWGRREAYVRLWFEARAARTPSGP